MIVRTATLDPTPLELLPDRLSAEAELVTDLGRGQTASIQLNRGVDLLGLHSSRHPLFYALPPENVADRVPTDVEHRRDASHGVAGLVVRDDLLDLLSRQAAISLAPVGEAGSVNLQVRGERKELREVDEPLQMFRTSAR